MEEEPALQPKKSPGDRVKPWQFKPGQSGNWSGKPKGAISMKTWARNMLGTMKPKERMEFLKGLNKLDIWKMGEGNPDNNVDFGGTEVSINFTKVEEVRKKIRGNRRIHTRSSRGGDRQGNS